MRCSNCGTENQPGFKFCTECGAALAAACPSCATPVSVGMKFCPSCGFALNGSARPVAAGAAPSAVAPGASSGGQAERRLVTVLFADLVGFTSTSETRDPEEVRDFLSRYFDISRRLVELYGGTVEKYIGDAVVAFWGATQAMEDDAERAVRAALDLVQAVSDLGEEATLPNLEARAAVLTGEAAVTVGAVTEGMVHGDVVNTASRVQALAAPGTVWVGDSTRRLSDAAIVYEDAGTHEVKGRDEPVHAWRALRVVAARGGSQRSHGLEPPFVGRDRELRLLKELFHACVEDGASQLVSITGIAGIGKSRLAWEFFKYIDGVADRVRWHAGRCLAYGEGVTYWALAEMVRMRARIVEGEVGEEALGKVREMVDAAVPDEQERRWIEPRIAQLVGLAEAVSTDRQDLFAAWRRFFERLSEEVPVVLVFEDMQWADPSLVEFIDYLLDWSRNYRLFIVTLGRAGESEKAVGRRGHTSIHLAPLGRPAMEKLITAVVPGLPDELRGRILDQSQGVPLYAVETIRMLLDRGLLVEDGSIYRPAGAIGELDVPETLHTLIAARLDGLSADERRLVQNAAILGKTFTAAGLQFVLGTTAYDIQEILTTLVRKEVFTVEASPNSPERGQYGFLQDLVRQVAYETLGRRERRELHLKVAAYLEQSFEEDQDEVVEVLASHYLEAYRADADAPDAEAIRAKAKDMLLGAGQRAGELGAAEEAQAYYDQAVELIDSPNERADVLDRAGQMAWKRGLAQLARQRIEQAISLLEAAGDIRRAALAEAHLAEIERHEGRLHEGATRLERALEVLAAEEPDEASALVAAQLGRLRVLASDLEGAAPPLELALLLAEGLELPEVFSEALNSKAMVLQGLGRVNESLLLQRAALNIALENGFNSAALRSYNNLVVALTHVDRFEEVLEPLNQALELARRIGDRQEELSFLVGATEPLVITGRWDEALARMSEAVAMAPGEMIEAAWIAGELGWLSVVEAARGDFDAARRRLRADLLAHEQVELRYAACGLMANLLNAEGRHAEALDLVQGVALASDLPPQSWAFKYPWRQAMEAALGLGQLRLVEELLARARSFRRGVVTPYLRAQMARFEGRLAALQEHPTRPEAGWKGAIAVLREASFPLELAICLLELGEWYRSAGRADEADEPVREAAQIFARLEATAWLARVGGTAVPAG